MKCLTDDAVYLVVFPPKEEQHSPWFVYDYTIVRFAAICPGTSIRHIF